MKGSFVRFFPLILDTLYNRTEQLLAKRLTAKDHFTHPKSTRAFYEQKHYRWSREQQQGRDFRLCSATVGSPVISKLNTRTGTFVTGRDFTSTTRTTEVEKLYTRDTRVPNFTHRTEEFYVFHRQNLKHAST